jgi:hypothetical protein
MTGCGLRTSLTAAAVACLSVAGPSGAQITATKPPTVLFLCPHGAAQSVLASAYFQRAPEGGLNVRVDSAGTEPDEQVCVALT